MHHRFKRKKKKTTWTDVSKCIRSNKIPKGEFDGGGRLKISIMKSCCLNAKIIFHPNEKRKLGHSEGHEITTNNKGIT